MTTEELLEKLQRACRNSSEVVKSVGNAAKASPCDRDDAVLDILQYVVIMLYLIGYDTDEAATLCGICISRAFGAKLPTLEEIYEKKKDDVGKN